MIDAQVRTTDILPTILSATGVAAPAELNGESLLPLIDGQTRLVFRSRTFCRDRLSAALGVGSSARLACRQYQVDRSSTAGALRPSGGPQGVEESLSRSERQFQFESPGHAGRDGEVEGEAAAAERPRASAGESLPDPKDKIEVQNLLHNAMLASDDNRLSDARQYLEKALQLDPARRPRSANSANWNWPRGISRRPRPI